jgi:tetratricopeptide (TPR) repeat protein/transglutaminase-like putative cysteine protease
MTRRLFNIAFSILLACTWIPNTEAQASSNKKVDHAKEAAIYERILNRVRFENDGTAVGETEAEIRVQSQAGVNAFGQLVFGYSSATEKLDVEYVRVRKPDGRVVVTPESTAQDFAPDILKEAPMYSDYRQRHISVASLEPGDTLEYRTVTRTVTPLAEGNFWYEHTFPKQVVVGEDRLEIDVPKSREVKLKAPKYPPQIEEKGDRRIYTWTLKDIEPDRDKNKAEDRDDDDNRPDVQLTTFTNWKQVAHWYAGLADPRAAVNDAVRKKAEELTQGAKTPEQKARRLYDYVARNVRYVSISLGVGRYQPHAASEVLANSYGDCKDKHTLLAALLKAVGIESYPVLIHHDRKLDVDVPSPAQFDHVITLARVGSKLTWLDTTPEVTPYGLLVYPLRNKQAIVASDDAEGGLQRTPADSPIKTFAHFVLDGKFAEFGALDATLEFTAQGDRDWPIRAGFRHFPEARWKDYVTALAASWGLPGDVDDVHVDPIEDTSRPFHLKFHLHIDGYFQVPAASVNFRPIPPLGVPAVRASEKSLEPINIGPAGEVDYKVRLEFPANYTVHTPLAVTMSRDYGDYSSTYSLDVSASKQAVLQGERKLVVKVNELPAARRSDYESFRGVAMSDQDQTLSCSIVAPSGAEAVAKMEGTPSELHTAGVKAFESNDCTRAITLLKRAVDSDSSLKDGWYDLGRAYAGANERAQAIHAFQKQIELDPNHKQANGDLAMELQLSGKNDEAIAAYRKQLTLAPFDQETHKNLGMLLAQLGRGQEARAELEAAVAVPPEDPNTKLALAHVYTKLGETAKAAELMKGLTGSAAGGGTGDDIYADALKSDIDPAQSETDAQKVLYDIGGQFDSGEFDRLPPAAFSSMRLVALSWARIGWAKYLKGDSLTALRFLNSAWLLSQSGTVANRLGQVYDKAGQREKAHQMYALAVAAGGKDVADSRQRMGAEASSGAASELAAATTVKLTGLTAKTGSARFNLVFDASPRPERAAFADGDEALRSASDQLRQTDFPVKFPDVSSIKIVRRAVVTCSASGCAVELVPIEKAAGMR